MTAIAEALAMIVGADRVVLGPVNANAKDEAETRPHVGSCAAIGGTKTLFGPKGLMSPGKQ